MRTVDVSRLARKVPASAAKSAKPPVAVKAKARSTPLAATAKTATWTSPPIWLAALTVLETAADSLPSACSAMTRVLDMSSYS